MRVVALPRDHVEADVVEELQARGVVDEARDDVVVEDLARDQIEYTDEDPQIRETFEAELARRGLKSQMPEPLYRDRDFRGAAVLS